MTLWLSVMAGLFAAVDLLAILTKKQAWRYMCKPGTMVWIILLATTGAADAGAYGWIILLGLVLSLAGDVFLVLPSDRFLAGLGSFFAAHVCYVAAFPAPWVWDGRSLTVAGVLLVMALLYGAVLRRGVQRSGGAPMLAAVACYVFVISLMVWRAALTGDALILAGAVLFYVSDAILAFNRFVKELSFGDFGVMTTYYTAQFLLAWSVVSAG